MLAKEARGDREGGKVVLSTAPALLAAVTLEAASWSCW